MTYYDKVLLASFLCCGIYGSTYNLKHVLDSFVGIFPPVVVMSIEPVRLSLQSTSTNDVTAKLNTSAGSFIV